MRSRRDAWLAMSIAIVLLAGPPLAAADYEAGTILHSRVVVVDGGTITMNGYADLTVRLSGVRAPSAEQVCHAGASSYSCGPFSKTILKALVGDREVRCTVADDRADPLTARCSVESDDGEPIDLGQRMVRYGVALADLSKDYSWDERVARNNRLGFWEYGDPDF